MINWDELKAVGSLEELLQGDGYQYSLKNIVSDNSTIWLSGAEFNVEF